jgi:outer membrane protein OmpA-like peptidoglycan-associated protein
MRLSAFGSWALQPKRHWWSLLEHIVALRGHFEGLVICLRRIISVGRAYRIVADQIRRIAAKTAAGGVPDEHRRRSSPWATAARVGVVGLFLYLPFLARSLLEIHPAAETRDAVYNQPPEIVLSSLTPISRVQEFYLLFKSGSAELEDESFKVLIQVSQMLSTYPNSRITLTLFFDPTVDSGHTSKLLASRLDGIKSFLAGQGVEADLRVFGRSGERLSEIKKPPEPRGLESWSKIRIETGK